MVTRSNNDYQQHVIDVYNKISFKYGEKKAKNFIRFYKDRYDRHGRSFLAWQAAWVLYDDWLTVKKTGIRWYAIVGTGGTGKTTLAKNIGYFLDPSFNVSRIKYTAYDIVKELKKFSTTGSMKSILLDEPDKTIAPQSRDGKLLANILGKARQQQLFMIYCATDLNDIPNYIYKKLTGIFFTPRIPKAMYFRDRPSKYVYPLGKIKREYYRKGYGIFFELRRSKGCLVIDTIKKTPLSAEEEARYDQEKQKDYEKSIDKFLFGDYRARDRQIYMLYKKGLSTKEIAKEFRLTRRRIQGICRKMRLNEKMK